MKQYKPGQFVSIGRTLARASIVKENTTLEHVCDICKRENGLNIPWCICASECSKKLGEHSYPKFIKLCINQDSL